MNKRCHFGFTVALYFMIATGASGELIGTFVDATAVNTTALDGGNAISAIGSDQYNGFWWERAGWGQDDTSILEGRQIDPIDLKTVITGLTPEVNYNIYVLYSGWATALAPKAGFTPGSLSPASDSPSITDTGDSGYSGYGVKQALIGQAVADEAGEITVYIDGNGGSRTWYDGVAYAPVPEPASVSLIAIGSVLALARRR